MDEMTSTIVAILVVLYWTGFAVLLSYCNKLSTCQKRMKNMIDRIKDDLFQHTDGLEGDVRDLEADVETLREFSDSCHSGLERAWERIRAMEGRLDDDGK